MRIYELSKQLEIPTKDLIELLQQKGFDVQTHMSALTQEMIDAVNVHFKQKVEPTKLVEPEKTITTKTQAAPIKEINSPSHTPSPIKPVLQEQEITPSIKELPLEAMTLIEFAEATNIPANDLIVTLLRQGIACTKNQMLALPTVKMLAGMYSIPLKAPQVKKVAPLKIISKQVGKERQPVIVVVGHVDHGKTTLLDFIRKTRVTAKEKGGITQHLGAYTVDTSHGKLVFLDTPGHEAFTKIRARGVNVADIAILVVAGDDGVMPQTVEALKHARAVNLPIIVAINKIDKATPVQLESTKRGLAQHDLLPEEWGGETIVVPISAKEGKNVDQLLEMIALQAEMLELKADETLPAKGFILEAKVQKGRGAVATVILHQGTLAVGDNFAAGTTCGRVNSIVDSHGKQLQKVGPSIPVLVAGFQDVPEAGDMLEVVTQDEFNKARVGKRVQPMETKRIVNADAINLLVKTDNKSSKEAILGSLEKLSQKTPKPLNVVYSGVGDISESDVNYAANTGSIIYGFHVKFEPNAAQVAQKEGVSAKLFDIIYKLLEDIEAQSEGAREVKEELKKVGEAEIRKVFNIKNLGVIAGSYVKDGRFVRTGFVKAYRGKEKIGEGAIKSLERDRKSVKEVHAGFEFAFLVDGIDDWQEGDRAECYMTVKVTE